MNVCLHLIEDRENFFTFSKAIKIFLKNIKKPFAQQITIFHSFWRAEDFSFFIVVTILCHRLN